jgi:hypothetical protein
MTIILIAEEEKEIAEMTQEEVVKLLLEEAYSWRQRKAIEALNEESLKKIAENTEISDSKLNSILSIPRKKFQDIAYWSDFVKDRIDNHNADEVGETIWNHIVRTGESADIFEKVAMESDWGMPQGLEIEPDLAHRILEKGINHRALEDSLELFEKDKKVLMDFLINRSEIEDFGYHYAVYPLEALATEEDYQELVKKVKNERIKFQLLNQYIKDPDYLKKYVKDYKGDRGDLQGAIETLIEETSDPEYFAELAKDPNVLEAAPKIISKFEDEDLFKKILQDKKVGDHKFDNDNDQIFEEAANNIHDEQFIMDFIRDSDEKNTDVFINLMSNLQDDALLTDIVENDLKELRHHALKLIKDVDFLKKIVDADAYDTMDIIAAIKKIDDEEYLFKKIKYGDYHPDVQRAAFSGISSKKYLKDIAEDEEMLYDIRRDILEYHEEIAEELSLDPEDFEDDKLIEMINSGEVDEDRLLLLVKSIDDSSDLQDIFGKMETGTVFDFIMNEYMAQDFEGFFEKIKGDEDKVEHVVNNLEDTDALKTIVEDDLLSDWDYSERGSIAGTIIARTGRDEKFIYAVLNSGYGGENNYEHVDYINDQDLLERLAQNDDTSIGEAAIGRVVDEEVLKDAMDWGEYFPARAFNGIKDAEWLKDWVKKDGEMPEDESYGGLIEHIEGLDDTGKYLQEIYLWAVEENSNWGPYALRALDNPELLEEALKTSGASSKSDKIREAVVNNDKFKNITMLRKLAQKDPLPSVRIQATKRLEGEENQELLKEIATDDKNAKVRLAAVNNITDDAFLRKRVYEEKDDEVAKLALSKIKGGEGKDNEEFLLDLYERSQSFALKRQALKNLPLEGNEELFKKAAMTSDDEGMALTALSKIKDDETLFEIATNQKALDNIRAVAAGNIQKQETKVRAVETLEDEATQRKTIIRLDGDHLKEEWLDMWWAEYQSTDEPHRVPVSAKLKAIEFIDKQWQKEDKEGTSPVIEKILKSLPYRHIPKKWQQEKRDISFEKPELREKDIGIHIPKANVQLYRLLLTMAR